MSLNIIQYYNWVPFLYLEFNKDLHNLTFLGKNLNNKKKLVLVRIVNSASMNHASCE